MANVTMPTDPTPRDEGAGGALVAQLAAALRETTADLHWFAERGKPEQRTFLECRAMICCRNADLLARAERWLATGRAEA